MADIKGSQIPVSENTQPGDMLMGIRNAGGGPTNFNLSVNALLAATNGAFMGLAEAETNPGIPVSARYYQGKAGVTYTYFKNAANQTIEIPLKVGSQYVVDVRLIWNGSSWSATWGLVDEPDSIGLLKVDDVRTKNGKNIYNYVKDTVGFLNIADGLPKLPPDNQAVNSFISEYIEVEPNAAYTISGRVSSAGSVVIVGYDANKAILPPFSGSQYNTGPTNGSFTTSEATRFIRFNSRFNGSGVPANIQLEKGSAATSFTPYSELVTRIQGKGDGIIAKLVETPEGNKSVADYVSSRGFTTNAEQATKIAAVDAKIEWKQHNTNFGLQIATSGADWYRSNEPSNAKIETDEYLLSLGIKNSIVYAQDQVTGANRRDIFYRIKYPNVIDGMYAQVVFFIKQNPALFSVEPNFVSVSGSPVQVNSLSTVITQPATGIWQIRKTFQVPQTGGFKEIWVGASFAVGGSAPLSPLVVSGFFGYISNENMANKEITAVAQPEIYKRIAEVEAKIPQVKDINYLKGKKIGTNGDSMVKGHNLSAGLVWDAMIAGRNDMILSNYGINGNRLTNTGGTGVPLVLRYNEMANDLDYILIFILTNDSAAGVAIGEDSDTVDTTVKGALNIICDGMLTKYPTKKIGFITPYLRTPGTLAYVEAIETICAKYSIPVFNNVKNGGVSFTNAAQKAALRLDDSYHLNAAGMLYASYKYEAFLRSL